MTPEQRPEVVQVVADKAANADSDRAETIRDITLSKLSGDEFERLIGALADHRIAAEQAALERAAQITDERAAGRRRLFEENGAGINAHKAVEAEEIAVAIRALASHPERRSENG